jgi:hypothetical protein
MDAEFAERSFGVAPDREHPRLRMDPQQRLQYGDTRLALGA